MTADEVIADLLKAARQKPCNLTELAEAVGVRQTDRVRAHVQRLVANGLLVEVEPVRRIARGPVPTVCYELAPAWRGVEANT